MDYMIALLFFFTAACHFFLLPFVVTVLVARLVAGTIAKLLPDTPKHIASKIGASPVPISCLAIVLDQFTSPPDWKSDVEANGVALFGESIFIIFLLIAAPFLYVLGKKSADRLLLSAN